LSSSFGGVCIAVDIKSITSHDGVKFSTQIPSLSLSRFSIAVDTQETLRKITPIWAAMKVNSLSTLSVCRPLIADANLPLLYSASLLAGLQMKTNAAGD
jgi:hypothetical protein